MRGMRRGSWLLVLAMCGTACGWVDPTPDLPVIPLSKVSVHNQTDEALLVRMNWPDGFVQVSKVSPSSVEYLSGAIGTSGFPRTIDVLDLDCSVLSSVQGLPPGSAGLVVIAEDGVATIAHLAAARGTWEIAETAEVCGATLDPPAA